MEEVEVDAELETDEEEVDEVPFILPPARHFGDTEGFVGPVEQTEKEKAALQKELHGNKK